MSERTPRPDPPGRGRAVLGVTLVIGLSLLGPLPGCSSARFRETTRVTEQLTVLDRHLHARTVGEALAPLAERFRLTVGDDLERGITRDALAEHLRWELALRRTTECEEFRFGEGTITARCHVENDFSRLIDFPGWDATVTWTFDARNRIVAQHTVPADDRDFRNWLAPAVAWLRQHRPADLEWLYPDGALNRSTSAARQWVAVLEEWRRATGRRPVPLGEPTAPAS